MLVPNRHGSSNSYRYGFNGMEKDDEIKGEGNSVNYEARMQDTRVGRFLSVDPLAKQFPSLTPYQFASNDPIESIDLDGKERYDYRWGKDDKGKPTLILVGKTDIVESVVVGYRNGHSLYNDAPVPVYETKINQREEFIVHTDYEVYLDNNGGLNMDKPQRKEVFDVRTFYKTKSDMLKGINGRESLSDRFKIAMAIHANAMGPENAALPAMGVGNLRKVSAVNKAVLTIEEGVLFSESEVAAASYMNSFGKNVTLRAPVGTRAAGATSDLVVNGVNYDVFTPLTNNPDRIISAIAKKNSQATGIVLDLSKTTVTAEQLGNVVKRVQGAGAKNIKDVVIMPK